MSDAQLPESMHDYITARRRLLGDIGCSKSCRDPLAELSEWIALKVLGGELASSRVQKGYDLITRSGRRVQVKYLSNPSEAWVNERCVQFVELADDYALILFESFHPTALLMFPRETLTRICQLLGKRHGNQELTLQFTRANLRSILRNIAVFSDLGVRVHSFNN